MSALPHVDPHARHGILYRTFVALSGTRVAMWLSPRLLWTIDPLVMRWSGGRIGMGLMLPTALLETRGARSGLLRTNAVIYFHDGDRVTIVASKLGLPEHPAWFHNLRANPRVRLNGRAFSATIVEGEEERARLWELADRVFEPYSTYRQRAAGAGRTIPIIQLTPAATATEDAGR